MLNDFVFVTDVKLVGSVLSSVTVYPIIPEASSVASIFILFVVAVATVTSGFSLSILSIFPAL